jgi:hypothetical protein
MKEKKEYTMKSMKYGPNGIGLLEILQWLLQELRGPWYQNRAEQSSARYKILHKKLFRDIRPHETKFGSCLL